MSAPDGGPAFPLAVPVEFQFANDGMTLRDWFAGQALAGFMASTKRPTTIAKHDAEWCFTIADALLAERSKAPADPLTIPLIVVTDPKGFVTLHEPNEDGNAGDLVASIWRDDWLPALAAAELAGERRRA